MERCRLIKGAVVRQFPGGPYISSMIRHLLSLLLLLPLCTCVCAQRSILLYPEGIPCVNDRTDADEVKPDIGRVVTDVHTPMMAHYAPISRGANGAAIMIIPGGGYWINAWDLEGVDIGRRFLSEGYHVFVLNYRLPGRETDSKCKTHVALDDARRGIQTIRMLADSLGYSNNKIAVMGFSAGGHLAASAAVHPLQPDMVSTIPAHHFSSRPNFSLPIYPVLIMDGTPAGHTGSMEALLGKDYHPQLRAFYDLPMQVHGKVPPTFLAHAEDDKAVPVENSLRYYQALTGHGVSAELHIFPTGGHGFGAARMEKGSVHNWLDLAVIWLNWWMN